MRMAPGAALATKIAQSPGSRPHVTGPPLVVANVRCTVKDVLKLPTSSGCTVVPVLPAHFSSTSESVNDPSSSELLHIATPQPGGGRTGWTKLVPETVTVWPS